MSPPEFIDVHVHLCRSVEQEKVVFPRPGYPDEWFWGNAERISAHMDRENMDQRFERAHGSGRFLLGENDHHFMKVKVVDDTATFTILRLPGGEVIAEYTSTRRRERAGSGPAT